MSSAGSTRLSTNFTEPTKSSRLKVFVDRVALRAPAVERTPSRSSRPPSLAEQKCHIDLRMRIASLVPSATEMLFASASATSVVAVTHECDYPPEAARLPHLTRTRHPGRASAPGEIDAEVKRVVGEGGPLRARRGGAGRLDADLIVTQAVCEVCAVSYDDVGAVAGRLPERAARWSALDPATLGRGPRRRRRLGEATGRGAAATACAPALEARLAAVRRGRRRQPRAAGARARVARPALRRRPLGAGDDRARGRRRRARRRRARSRARSSGRSSQAAAPEVVVAMPCGFYAEDARDAGARAPRAELERARGRAGRRRRRRVVVLAARARAWSTASSCSATSSIPSGSAPPRASDSRRWTCRRRRLNGDHLGRADAARSPPRPRLASRRSSTTRPSPSGRTR